MRNLALTLNDMLDRLGAAQERQRGLVSDTAHELRSPIASIRAQLEVALDHPDSQDWRQTAGDVLADTLRLARLAEDLLALARLDERDPRRPAQRQVDLASLVREEVSRYADARIPVRLAGTGPAEVTGDPDGLRRMLSNLIDNATRYARSQVAVSVGMTGKNARISVTDDGPGIPAGDRERAFGRFSRLEADRSRDSDDEGRLGARPGHRAGHRPGARRVSLAGGRLPPGCGPWCCCPGGTAVSDPSAENGQQDPLSYQAPQGSSAVTAMTANSSVR